VIRRCAGPAWPPRGATGYRGLMGPWTVWLWRLLRNKRFRSWLLATAGPRALALFLLWIERVRHRQVAIGEADQIDGMFSAAIVDGQRHVVVWKDGEPISAYPAVAGDLAAKLRNHARRDLTRPVDLPSRRARRWLGARAGDARGGAARIGAGVQEVRRRLPGGGRTGQR
jgi:hypothetical protein